MSYGEIVICIILLLGFVTSVICWINVKYILKPLDDIHRLVRATCIKVAPELTESFIREVEKSAAGDGTGKVHISGGLEEEVRRSYEEEPELSEDDYFEQAKGNK